MGDRLEEIACLGLLAGAGIDEGSLIIAGRGKLRVGCLRPLERCQRICVFAFFRQDQPSEVCRLAGVDVFLLGEIEGAQSGVELVCYVVCVRKLKIGLISPGAGG